MLRNATEMKILNLSVTFISKFKTNHFITSCRKSSFFCRRIETLHATLSSFIFPIFRCFSVSNLQKLNSLQHTGGKVFQEKENEYAHKIMENLSYYSNSLLKHPLQYDCYQSSESYKTSAIDKFVQVTLDNVSKGETLENIEFTSLVKELCFALSEASDEDIKRTLHYLCLWPSASSTTIPNFKNLWNKLDYECVKRMKQWDVSEKLLFGDYWFYLKLSRITRYNSALIYNLTQNIDSLSNHQVVQLMFYVNLQRKIPDVFLHSLEKKLELIISSLTPEELGIICLGFFKTQNSLSNVSLIKCIIKKLMYNVEGLNTVTVAAILKFLRKSREFSLIDLYILTLHKCVPCIDNFDIPTSVHLALLASECNVYHPLLLNCVSEKLSNEMHNVRIKDCVKLLLCLSLFNHFEGTFHELFLVEIKKKERQIDIMAYPSQIIHSVLYYSYKGYYDYDLLTKIFEKNFFEEACLKHPELRITYAEIDCSVEIECPDYKGPKLDASVREILHHRRGNLPSQSQKRNMIIRLLNDVNNSLVKILGSDENVLIRHILPHVHSPDIIVRLSGNRERSLSNICQDISANLILRPLPGEIWAAFVIGGTYSLAYKSTHMTGLTAMKVRQLQNIGYHVVFLPFFCISQQVPRRESFLKEKLNMLEENLQTVAY